jgi:hypothetical protein
VISRGNEHSSRQPLQSQITGDSQERRCHHPQEHSNGPNHAHDLRASDILKRPTEVVEYIEAVAAKGYHVPAIKGAANEHFKDRRLSIELSTVLNVQHKVRGGMDVPSLALEILKTISGNLGLAPGQQPPD